jgi:biopolymer transport protein ExbB
MIELFLQGGITMPFILLCSIIAVAIIIERLIFFRKIKIDEGKMIDRLKQTLEKKHFDEALSICETNPSPVTNLMKVGIEHRQYGTQILKDAIVDAANLEIPNLERNISALGTIASIAPLLGLLGTVIGIIISFRVIGGEGILHDPSLLAQGIAQALVSTASGIIVALPAIIFYNYLINKVNHIIIRLENRVNSLVLLLLGRGDA